MMEITSVEPRISMAIQWGYDLHKIQEARERRAVAVGLWSEGHSTLQIAAAMGVGRRTINNYLREVRQNGE